MNAQDRKMLEQVNSNWLIGSVIAVLITIGDAYLLVADIFSGNAIDVDRDLKLSVVLVILIVVSWFLVRRYQQSKEQLSKE